MPRHLDNLDRLCNNLHRRHDALNPMVLQVKAGVEACKVNETNEHAQHDWAIPYRTWVKDRNSQLMRRISS